MQIVFNISARKNIIFQWQFHFISSDFFSTLFVFVDRLIESARVALKMILVLRTWSELLIFGSIMSPLSEWSVWLSCVAFDTFRTGSPWNLSLFVY